MQADSAGRALSSLITKMLKNGGFPYAVFTKLYQACVCSVSLYGSEIFGYEHFNSTFKLHLRAARAYLGLPKNVASYGLISELDWLLPQYMSQIKMVQYYGRILRTSSHRLMYKIYKLDLKLNESGLLKSWSHEIKTVLQENNLTKIFIDQHIFPEKSIALQLQESMMMRQRTIIENECANKPKLRTFMTFKDFRAPSPHLVKPLTFVERRTFSKLRLGILPIRIETARCLVPTFS